MKLDRDMQDFLFKVAIVFILLFSLWFVIRQDEVRAEDAAEHARYIIVGHLPMQWQWLNQPPYVHLRRMVFKPDEKWHEIEGNRHFEKGGECG